MIPGSQQRKPRNSSKVNLLISLTFHGVILVALLYFAAREGLLGKQIKKLAVEMVREKPPEKPKEAEKPKEETPKPEEPKAVETAKAAPPKATEQAAPPPAGNVPPPAIAPEAADVPSFAFDGGVMVETSKDPLVLYKELLRMAIESHWDRPENIEDSAYVADVEIGVDRKGQISNPVWKKETADKRWNDSVWQAIARTTSVSSTPPTNFPPRVILRFDVVALEPVVRP